MSSAGGPSRSPILCEDSHCGEGLGLYHPACDTQGTKPRFTDWKPEGWEAKVAAHARARTQWRPLVHSNLTLWLLALREELNA